MTKTGDNEPQNIYDNPTFFEGYRQLRQNDTGLNGVLETPALQALLPELAGLNVLDLGCGFGHFARHARSHGARSVTGLDVSEKMLAEAARLTQDAQIVYRLGSMEAFSFVGSSFDLVVSSMALHYIADFAAIARQIFGALRVGGQFIFSVEHPVCTSNPVGWIKESDGLRRCWPLDRYQEEGPREMTWSVDGVVKFHRTTETYVNTLIAAGFQLGHLGEPKPLPVALLARPALADELKRPPVLLLAATRLDSEASN